MKQAWLTANVTLETRDEQAPAEPRHAPEREECLAELGGAGRTARFGNQAQPTDEVCASRDHEGGTLRLLAPAFAGGLVGGAGCACLLRLLGLPRSAFFVVLSLVSAIALLLACDRLAVSCSARRRELERDRPPYRATHYSKEDPRQ